MTTLQLDSRPFPASVPFANEGHLQQFVEERAKPILGVDIIASSRRGGGRLFDIDILAIDDAYRPYIMECKWDVVHNQTLQQLERYKSKLQSNWNVFEARVGKVRNRTVRIQKVDPVLVAIGYRCASSVLTKPPVAHCLTYVYHNLELVGNVLEKRRRGKVSIQPASEISPRERHPRISKIFATIERLKLFPQKMQEAFWNLDGKLLALRGVEAEYLGKGFVSYWRGNRVFTKVEIGPKMSPKVIRLRFRRPMSSGKEWDGVIEMEIPSDETKVFRALWDAYHDRA